MIIELCGLPSSGKTTLVKKLEETKLFFIIKVNNKKPVIINFLRYFLRRPTETFRATWWAIMSADSFSHFWNTLFFRYAKYELAQKNSSLTQVIDEGPCQNIYSYAKTMYDIKLIKSRLDKMPKVDSLILLAIPESLRQQNLIKRVKLFPHMKNMRTPVKEKQMLGTHQMLLELLKNYPNCYVAASVDEAFVYIMKKYGNT